MKKLLRCEVFILFVFLLCTGITSAQEHESIKRWVSGTVVATDTKAIPNTIVITAVSWKGKELIVGAQVLSDTEITIDRKTAHLLNIKIGDKVSMIYLRESTRLVARKIEVKRQK